MHFFSVFLSASSIHHPLTSSQGGCLQQLKLHVSSVTYIRNKRALFSTPLNKVSSIMLMGLLLN